MSGQRRSSAAGRWRAGDQLNLPSGMAGDAPREVGDGNLLTGADVIDAEMLALVAHHHDAGHQVVDEAETARFLAAALDVEAHAPCGLCLRELEAGAARIAG